MRENLPKESFEDFHTPVPTPVIETPQQSEVLPHAEPGNETNSSLPTQEATIPLSEGQEVTPTVSSSASLGVNSSPKRTTSQPQSAAEQSSRKVYPRRDRRPPDWFHKQH